MSDASTRIMVADEQTGDVEAVIQALRADGYAFVVAKDGDEAVRLAVDAPPDLIIVDATLPKQDGFAVARALRAHPDTKHAAIIMVGDVPSEEVARKSFASGADDFVPKPIVPAHLRARVQTWLLRKERGS